VAFPHARIKDLHQAVAAFVRTCLPIPFDAPDEKPVSEILVLLVPDQATEQHLRILASAARMFGDRNFREQLRMCADTSSVSQLFADWPTS
jgi:PTS system nitrogen regulatory IIA component